MSLLEGSLVPVQSPTGPSSLVRTVCLFLFRRPTPIGPGQNLIHRSTWKDIHYVLIEFSGSLATLRPRVPRATRCGGDGPAKMAQTALIIIFVGEFALALGALLTWKSDYELSSFEERHPPPPTPPGRCWMLQLAHHRRIKTRRQRQRCRLGSHWHRG